MYFFGGFYLVSYSQANKCAGRLAQIAKMHKSLHSFTLWKKRSIKMQKYSKPIRCEMPPHYLSFIFSHSPEERVRLHNLKKRVFLINPFAVGVSENLCDLYCFFNGKGSFGRLFLGLSFAGINRLLVAEYAYIWAAFLACFLDFR